MTRYSCLGVGCATIFGLVVVNACGPGPLPPENPTQTLDPAPEPVAVEVNNTSPPAPGLPGATPTLPAPAPTPAIEAAVVVPADTGLKTPESVLFDPASDRYFVSNINGSPSGVDNNGFISLINPDGSVHTLEFIAGGKGGVTLNAPKGLALHGGTLFVADIDAVRKFDAKTGAAQGAITFPKATFINDVVVDAEGVLYASDTGIKIHDGNPTPTGTDAIYKVVNGKVTVLAKGAHLGKPNGVALFEGSVLTVTFGNKQLIQLDANGKVSATVALPAGTLDGIVVLPDGRLLVSSWEAQTVYVGSLTGSWSAVSENLASPADIGFDPGRNRVLVPLFTQNELRFVPATVPGLPSNTASSSTGGEALAATTQPAPAAQANPTSATKPRAPAISNPK